MTRRPLEFYWRPQTFLGRVLAFALALCLFAILLLVSVAAVSIAIVALALYSGYWWYKWWRYKRSSAGAIRERPEGGLIIDVTPHAVEEYSVEEYSEESVRRERREARRP